MARGHPYFWVRRNLEWLVAVSVAFVLLWKRGWIARQFLDSSWNIDSFYSAVFDWSSIQAAFLFSVYAFFLSRSEPFIQAIAKTKPFRDLRAYVLRALSLTMSLTVTTLPLLVAPIKVKAGGLDDLGFAIFALVSVVLAYAFMCFVKVIRVFNKLERLEGP